jgi:hypothetical protein
MMVSPVIKALTAFFLLLLVQQSLAVLVLRSQDAMAMAAETADKLTLAEVTEQEGTPATAGHLAQPVTTEGHLATGLRELVALAAAVGARPSMVKTQTKMDILIITGAPKAETAEA